MTAAAAPVPNTPPTTSPSLTTSTPTKTSPPGPAPSAEVELPLASVHVSPFNPRRVFNEADVKELAESIRKRGLLQAILVRPKKGSKDQYEIVYGETRWRASKMAGRDTIRATVRDLPDAEALEIQLEENMRRSSLHPLDEADGFHRLTQPSMGSYSVERLMERFGRDQVYVRDRLRLIALHKDAQALFREGRLALGHSLALARLSPQDQLRTMDPNHGGLWEDEKLIWGEDDEKGKYAGLKARSVRELQEWIDGHIRVDVKTVTEQLPELFPDSATAVKSAQQKAERIVSITTDADLDPKLKPEGERVYMPEHWKRADGRDKSKPCDLAVTGVIVIGEGRGEAFRVCIDKRHCKTHWAAEQRARQKIASTDATTSKETYEQQQKRVKVERENRENRWAKALPAMLKALADAVRKLPAKASGQLADELISTLGHRAEKECKEAAKYLARGTSAEDLVRYIAFFWLYRGATEYWAPHADEFKKRAAAYGVDVAKIIKEANPDPKAAKPAAAAKTTKAGPKAKK